MLGKEIFHSEQDIGLSINRATCTYILVSNTIIGLLDLGEFSLEREGV